MASQEDHDGPRRKRSRTSKSEDSDDNKKRGRPRVEKQDQSAADRRRTQIRMAQRAYRQRKESTLEELRKRVSELTSIIEVMNKTFDDCKDRLLATNLPEAQMRDLYETADQYATLVQSARNPTDDFSATGNEDAEPRRTSAPSNDAPAILSAEDSTPTWLDKDAISHTQPEESLVNIGMGYAAYLPEADERNEEAPRKRNHDYFSLDNRPQMTVEDVQVHPPRLPNSFDIYRAEIPEAVPLIPELSPPLTYSFQETTFGRRLHRACMESGYGLLLDPTKKPTTVERVFKLSLMGRDRAKLTQAMKEMLARGPHEELDFWGSPLIHVGGAGTHYARRDAFGNLLPKKVTQSIGLIGPQALALLENAARDQIGIDMTVDLAGYEGEWFDPYDVQGYLEEKGIYIDPQSSFAEAEVDEWVPTPSMSGASILDSPESSIAGPKTPHTQTPPHTVVSGLDLEQGQELDASHIDFNFDSFSDMTFSGVGYSDAATGSFMNFVQHDESDKVFSSSAISSSLWNETSMMDDPAIANTNMDLGIGMAFPPLSTPPTPPARKRLVIIDVAKLVKVLTVSGVCLGRSPGFRRKDIDRALSLSAFDAF